MADSGMLAAREQTPEPAGAAGAAHATDGQPLASPRTQGGSAGAAAEQQPTMLGEQGAGPLGRVGADGAGGSGGGGGYRVSDSADAELAATAGGGGEEYNPETAFDDADKGKLAPGAATLDWAKIRAAAATAAAAEQQAGGAGGAGSTSVLGGGGRPLGSLQSLPSPSLPGESSDARQQRHHHKHHHHSHHQRQHTSPLEMLSPHEASSHPALAQRLARETLGVAPPPQPATARLLPPLLLLLLLPLPPLLLLLLLLLSLLRPHPWTAPCP